MNNNINIGRHRHGCICWWSPKKPWAHRCADWIIEIQNGAQQKGRGEHQGDESIQYSFFAPVIMKTWHYQVHLPSSQDSGFDTEHTHMIWALWNGVMHSCSGPKSLVSYHMISKSQLNILWGACKIVAEQVCTSTCFDRQMCAGIAEYYCIR